MPDDVAWLNWLEWYWWCVRSWLNIRMIHWSMGDDSRVADEVYIKIGCLVLEDFLFFFHYSFSCRAKQARLWPRLDCCLVSTPLIRNSKPLLLITIWHYCCQYHLCPIPPITVEKDAILRGAWKKWRLAEQDAIWGVPGKSPEYMSAVHIYILDASSLLWSMKRQVHRMGEILHAPNSRMLALVSKSAIDARIGGWFKPTYQELDQTHLKNSRHRNGCITTQLSWPGIWNTEKWVDHDCPMHITLPMVGLYPSSSSFWVVTAWHRIDGVLKNLAEFGQRIELGPLWVATVEVT